MTALEAIPKISELLGLLVQRVKDRQTATLVQQIQQHQLVIHAALVQSDAKLRELEAQLAKAQAEEIIIHEAIEFRRGKRTRGKWLGFCPKCHMPAQDASVSSDGGRLIQGATCSADCGWHVSTRLRLESIIAELGV